MNQAFNKTIDVPLIPTFTTPSMEIGEARIYNHRIEIDAYIPFVVTRTLLGHLEEEIPAAKIDNERQLDLLMDFVVVARSMV